MEPPDLPTHYYGYNAKFSIFHALYCKKGGLITTCHNEIRDGVSDLTSKDLNPTHMYDDPGIFTGRAVRGG